MPQCPRCKKEVYFAERKTSLGKDWHAGCLKCKKCNKTLSPGQHADVRKHACIVKYCGQNTRKTNCVKILQHEGDPYCNKPCYAALFGPKGFGHGGAESHTYN